MNENPAFYKQPETGGHVPETSSSQVPPTEQKHTVNTTNDDGHKHTGVVDANGNGVTDGLSGHSHEIVNMQVQMAHGHGHNLIDPSVFRRGQRQLGNQFDFEGLGLDPHPHADIF